MGASFGDEAEVNLALARCAPSATSSKAIGRLIGYAHAVDAALWGEDLPQDLEPGTWDLDLFIASEEHRGRGAGGRRCPLLKCRSVRDHDGRRRVRASFGAQRGAPLEPARRPGSAGSALWNDPQHGTELVHGRGARTGMSSGMPTTRNSRIDAMPSR